MHRKVFERKLRIEILLECGVKLHRARKQKMERPRRPAVCDAADFLGSKPMKNVLWNAETHEEHVPSKEDGRREYAGGLLPGGGG